MLAWAGLLSDRGGEVGQRLGELSVPASEEPVVEHGVFAKLLLEQRVQHDRADTTVREAPDAVDGA